MPPKGKGKKGPPESGWKPGFGTKGNKIYIYLLDYLL